MSGSWKWETLVVLSLAFSVITQQLDGGENGKEGSALVVYDVFAANANRVVVGVVGFSGKPHPDQWLFLCLDKKNSERLVEVVVRNGKAVAERQVVPLPGQDVPDIPFERRRIKIDSHEAEAIARKDMAKSDFDFDSIHYHLRCRNAKREPIWLLSLRNSASVEVGKIYLSAESGEILRRVGVGPKMRIESSAPLSLQ